ncbi:MAG: glycosyltransferase N-terminal domain-containing protein [Fimbriimonadaceae bacterium]
MFILYNLFFILAAPVWVPWMLWRTSRRKEKPNWAQRLGRYPMKPRLDRRRIWFHAVSVGEVLAALPILRELRRRLPGFEIVLSVTTSSGHQTAREQADGLFDHLVYFPIDTTRYQFFAMASVRPAAVAIMETELWPNFLWAAKAFDARTLIVNGRISDRSFPRYRALSFLFRGVLGMVDRRLMQTSVDAERIRAIGGGEAEVFGNVKFDQALEGVGADAGALRCELGIPADAPVVVIGSTRGDDEERLVLDAIREVGPERAWYVHAPRHLERADALTEMAESVCGRDRVARRSKGQTGRYLILDTYGELAKVYGIADVVVIGGGFANHGGQNLVQALAHGKPVIHGPHMHNFREVAEMAAKAGATEVAASASELAAAVTRLLAEPERRAQMGEAAAALVRSGAGAARRYAEAIAAEAEAMIEEEERTKVRRR